MNDIILFQSIFLVPCDKELAVPISKITTIIKSRISSFFSFS